MITHLLDLRSVFSFALCTALALSLALAVHAAGEELARTTVQQTAREIYDSGATMRGLWMWDSDDAIRLFWGDVLQNDSPVCGSDSSSPGGPFEILGEGIVLRKQLTVEDPRADEVYVTFIAKELRGHDAALRIVVTGNETLRPPSTIATPDAKQYWELAWSAKIPWNASRWYYVSIPVEHLQVGDNVIEFSTVDGAAAWQIMVGDYANFNKAARAGETPAHASAKSTDGGKTWDSQHMGEQNAFAGEYVIRLAMRRYRESGWIVSEVLDAAGQQDEPIKIPLQVSSVYFRFKADMPDDTAIAISLRWGDTPYYEADSWTSWQWADVFSGRIPARGRYLQWKAELSTTNPLVSLALKSVRIVTNHEQARKQDKLRIVEMNNPSIIRSSYDFPFERYDHPKLQQLRQVCDLDKVVAGAKDDWEMIRRLMRWAYLLPLPNCKICPWEVLDWIEIKRDENGEIILNKYETRRRDRMCLYSNVVLTEMLLAVGIPARHTNINSEGMSGHEVCEAWSNVHHKWLQVDATRDFYWVDKTTREPLSTLDVHNELIQHLDKVETWQDPFRLRINSQVYEGMQVEAYGGEEWPYKLNVGWSYKTHAHFRIIPRNDYCEHPYPLPISQGSEVWCWDGYLNWADDMVPPLMHFSHHTNRPGDFYWTNNQAHMTLLRTGERQLTVLLEHDMPNFARYEASTDGGEWAPVESGFTLELEPGTTELAVRAVNTMGLPGPVSRAVVELAQ